MKLSCPNCNQTVLNTDTVCWHCGYQLPQLPIKSAPQLERQTAVTKSEAFSLSAVFVYGGVTTVVIIGLLLSMRILGQKPLILLNPDTTINADWVPVTDSLLDFTLDIPPTWQSFARNDPQQRAGFEALLTSDKRFMTAVFPLDAAVTDMELLLMAVDEKPEPRANLPGFVIVTRSEVLGRLSLDEIVALARQVGADVEMREIEIFRSFTGDERASLSLKIPAPRDGLRCQQHIIPGTGERYLVVGCAPETSYQVYSESIEKILLSFQSLR